MVNEWVEVNVGEGYLPRFVPGFLGRYGAGSEFVQTASDVLTLATAKVMERAGLLTDPSDVARFSDDAALRALRDLLAAVDRLSVSLLQEACGAAALGAVANAVDAELGGGAFSRWLAAFEERDHERCGEVLAKRA